MKLKKLTKWMATLLSVICCQSALAEIQITAWYPSGADATYTIDSTFSCGKYAKISANYLQWSPAQFQLHDENDVNIPISDIDRTTYASDKFTLSTIVSGKDTALKIDFSNGGDPDHQQVWSTTFYVDLSGKPYKLYSAVPHYRAAMAEADLDGATELTTPSQNFALIGSFCASNSSITPTGYIWETSDNGVDWMPLGYSTQTVPSHTQNTDTAYYRLTINSAIVSIDDDGNEQYDSTYTDTSKVLMVRYKMPTVKLTASAADEDATYFTSTEFEVKEKSGNVNFRAVPTGFGTDVTYELQYRPLEGNGTLNTEWEKVEGVTFDATTKKLENFHPSISSEYRLKATGTSAYSGNSTSAYSEEVIVIRKTYDLSEGELEAMWNEDFGRFTNDVTYITSDGETFKSSMTDDAGNEYPIEYFWAPDLHNYVKEHVYATESDVYKNYGKANTDYSSWLKNKHRLEDGYYIITSNPTKGDNNNEKTDYQNAPDHTGNTNGGMLFVNVKDGLQGVLIYERSVDFNCDVSSAGITMLFTSYINNASFNATTPVNLRWELCEVVGQKTTTVYTVASGDIKNREDFESKWANMSFRFTAKSQHYVLRLYNNAPGGANWGNDIVVDDISVKLSYPTVDVNIDKEPSCLGQSLVISATSPEGDFSKYFTDPKFAYLYKNAGTNGKWAPYNSTSSTKDQTVNITNDMMGTTYYRVVVAPDQTILDKIVTAIVNGTTLPARDCANIYAISDSIPATHSRQFDSHISKESLAITEFCQNTDQELSVSVENDFDFAAPTKYYWYYKKLGEGAVIPLDSTTTTSHTYSTADGLFSEPGQYLLYVRAVDSLCQTSNAEDAKEWNDACDTITVVRRNQLALSLPDTSFAHVKYLTPVTINVFNDDYTGDTLIWKDSKSGEMIRSNDASSATFTEQFVPSNEYIGNVCYHIEAPEQYTCVDKSDEICVEIQKIKLLLTKPDGEFSVKYSETTDFTIDKNGYTRDSVIWNETSNGTVQVAPETLVDGNQQFNHTSNEIEYDVCYYVSAPEQYTIGVDPSDKVCIEADLGVIPSLITPTDDPLGRAANNYFLLSSDSKEATIPGVHVRIFNRYQQTIFEGEDGWDATYRGGIAEPGTYYYIITLKNGEMRKGYLEVGKFNSK